MSNNPFFKAQAQPPPAASNNPFATTNPFWQAGTQSGTTGDTQNNHPLSADYQTTGRSSVLHHAVSSVSAPTSAELTPLRAHYLKKTLINLEIERELNALSDPALGAAALGRLGPPFLMLDRDGKPIKPRPGSEQSGLEDLPFIRYMFHQFLLPFPFLANAPPTFWSHKVQPFLTSFLAISQMKLSPAVMSMEDSSAEPDLSLLTEDEVVEYQERKKLWDKLIKNMAMLFGAGVQLSSGEEVVRIGQRELKRLEEQAEARRKRLREREDRVGSGFDVNVICVRTVTEKGRVRNRSHDVSRRALRVSTQS